MLNIKKALESSHTVEQFMVDEFIASFRFKGDSEMYEVFKPQDDDLGPFIIMSDSFTRSNYTEADVIELIERV